MIQYTMASSVPRPVPDTMKAIPERKAGKKTGAHRSRKGLFGLLKGWSIDSQALSDELKD